MDTTNKNPLVALVLFGGSASQKSEMAENIINLYPINDDYELILISNKKEKNYISLSDKSAFTVLNMNKGYNSIDLISSKVLKHCAANYIIFQNVNEKLFNIKKFVETIRKKGVEGKIVAFSTPARQKKQYVIEDAPLLLTNKDISNIAFPRFILEKENKETDPYEWKAQSLLNADYFSLIPMKVENQNNAKNPTEFFEFINDQITKYINMLGKIKVNKYIKNALVINYYEMIVSKQIGLKYKEIIKSKNGSLQVNFLNQLEKWLKAIDLEVLSFIPAIRYYFIRWSIDNYNSISYFAKRRHIRIVKYIVNNMHFDSHQIYLSKHAKLYPAAIKAARLNSVVPIYLYLAKRKLKKVDKKSPLLKVVDTLK
jgi:hypothetical protein